MQYNLKFVLAYIILYKKFMFFYSHNYNSNMEGYQFFDTTLGKPCYAKTINNNGIVTWVDATGNDI